MLGDILGNDVMMDPDVGTRLGDPTVISRLCCVGLDSRPKFKGMISTWDLSENGGESQLVYDSIGITLMIFPLKKPMGRRRSPCCYASSFLFF